MHLLSSASNWHGVFMIEVCTEDLMRDVLDIKCIVLLLAQLTDTVIIESELEFVLVKSEWFLSQAERVVSSERSLYLLVYMPTVALLW